MRTNIIKAAAIALLITACGGSKKEATTATPAESKVVLSDQLMMSTLWMQKSHEAKYLQRQAYELAALKLDANMKKGRSKKPLAIILDLDETVLDNSPYEARLVLTGKNFTMESWNTWVMEAQAEPVAGAREFLEKANRLGLEIFYISNRAENHLEATVRNLQRLELPFADEGHVLLKNEDSSSKTERRERIKQTHKVVLLVGDQMGDFSEEPFIEEEAIREGFVSPLMDSASAYFVLLPNPLYGSFESGIYGGQRGLSDEVKNQYRRKALDPKQDMVR